MNRNFSVPFSKSHQPGSSYRRCRVTFFYDWSAGSFDGNSSFGDFVSHQILTNESIIQCKVKGFLTGGSSKGLKTFDQAEWSSLNILGRVFERLSAYYASPILLRRYTSTHQHVSRLGHVWTLRIWKYIYPRVIRGWKRGKRVFKGQKGEEEGESSRAESGREWERLIDQITRQNRG